MLHSKYLHIYILDHYSTTYLDHVDRCWVTCRMLKAQGQAKNWGKIFPETTFMHGTVELGFKGRQDKRKLDFKRQIASDQLFM